jgi:hypothetical protein
VSRTPKPAATRPEHDDADQAAVFSPDARWHFLGRGTEGTLRADGEHAVFIVWWKGQGKVPIRPPQNWAGGPIEVPDGIDPFRGTSRENLPTVLVALISNGVPVHASTRPAPHEAALGADVESLLPSIESAAHEAGPALLAQMLEDGSVSADEAEQVRTRLADAVRLFKRTGWTVPLDEKGEPADTIPAPPARDHLPIPSPSIYAGLQRALALNRFERIEGGIFPRANLDRGEIRGFAELRPITPQEEVVMAPEEVTVLADRMWQWHGELSDRDADVMDAIAATWIQAAPKNAGERVPIRIDDLLKLRGLKAKKDGSGQRYGYEPEQRAALWRSLLRLQEIWIDIAEATVFEGDRGGRRRRKKRTIQSRAFLMSDRVGQRRLDGTMDVEAILVAPGEAFGRFLLGPGRQVALLSSKALAYDPHRRKSEKRLTRFFAWQWRVGAKSGDFVRTYRVRTLLEETGAKTPDNETLERPARARSRLEEALDMLQKDGAIALWQYAAGWDEDKLPTRKWAGQWMEAGIVVEAPDVIKDAYRHIDRRDRLGAAREPAITSPWAARIRTRRRVLAVSQVVAAEQLGVSQPYFSELERGVKQPSTKMRRHLEAWLRGSFTAVTGVIVVNQESSG